MNKIIIINKEIENRERERTESKRTERKRTERKRTERQRTEFTNLFGQFYVNTKYSQKRLDIYI